MNTAKWFCDKCNQPINKPEAGYVEWLRKIDNDELSGFHIVHQETCLYDEEYIFREEKCTVPGHHLLEFLGEDGLIRLLRFLSVDNLKNKEEVLELIKRLHIRGYESARFYFSKAYSEDIIDGPNEVGSYYPLTSQINKINTTDDYKH